MTEDENSMFIVDLGKNVDFALIISTLLELTKPFLEQGVHIEAGANYEPVELENPFDPLKGTAYESPKKIVLSESPITKYIPRQIVYDALRRVARPGKLEGLLKNIDSKFPASVWKNNFPEAYLVQYLMNNERDIIIPVSELSQ